MIVSMQVGQSFLVVLRPVGDDGNPGFIDGPPLWFVDLAGMVSLTVSADGLTANITGTSVGQVNVTPSATAAGKAIQGAPIAITVNPLPEQAATQLLEDIGPVTQGIFGKMTK